MTPPADPAVSLASLQRQPAAALLALAAERGLAGRRPATADELTAALLHDALQRHQPVLAEGALELLPDGFGFLRSWRRDYRSGADDVFVSPSLVRGHALRQGHRLAGPLRGPRGTEKFFALDAITAVHEGDPAAATAQVPFAARTPILPRRPLAVAPMTPALRALARLAPWCRGHRALLSTPPTWPRARFVAALAAAVREADPAPWLLVGLLDQRPEDVVAARDRLDGLARCEVVASTFDEAPARHLALAEMVLARAQREVEAGADVVLLVDSLTALAHAAHVVQPATGRWLCPGLDAAALGPGKRLFAAARALAEGGSLTVIAAANLAPGTPTDDAIVGTFRDRGNSDVVVRDGADAGAPFDPTATRTRPEDLPDGAGQDPR